MSKKSPLINITILFQFFGLIITGLYVFQVNTISTKGYVLKALQEERVELVSIQEGLNLKISKLQSFEILKKDLAIKSMISYLQDPIYINSENLVALR